MKYDDVRHIVIREMGDKYYSQLHDLKEDMEFFTLYLQRNKKCDGFYYTIIPCESFAGFKAFIDIYEQFGYGQSYLEEVYTIFKALKLIVLDIYNETNKFTHEEVKEFAEYFEHNLELDIREYVYLFIGCSHGTAGTVSKLQEILEES